MVLHLDGETGPVDLPFTMVADHPTDGRIDEMRLYYSSWPLIGRHSVRAPLLQPDPGLRAPDVVAEYERALAAGDIEADRRDVRAGRLPARAVPATSTSTGARTDCASFYEPLFSNGGGVPLEPCAIVDDGRTCALEFNVVGWGRTEQPPQAGVAVFVRGDSGRLAAVRLYDDIDRPITGSWAPGPSGARVRAAVASTRPSGPSRGTARSRPRPRPRAARAC